MTIPASKDVSVTPSVLTAGGAAIALTGLLLTQATRVPIGAPTAFGSALAASNYFGANSAEANYAAAYFQGYDNSLQKPSSLLIAQYPVAAVGPFIRGGSLAGMTLAQLQAVNATLNVTLNGQVHTGTVNLSAAAGFTAAAAAIQAALAPTADAVVTGSISATTLTVSAVTSGALAVGQTISGAGVTVGTKITAILTGTGGIGTYTVSQSQTAAGTTITAGTIAVAFDSQSNAFVITGGTASSSGSVAFCTGAAATSLNLTAATGAVLSQGANAATPAAFMNSLIGVTQNWGVFTTNWETADADALAFAGWTSAQSNRYAFILWDTDATVPAGVSGTCVMASVTAAAYSGVIPVWQPSELYTAGFVLGIGACFDFTKTNGRATYKFRSQSGLTPGVTDLTSLGNVQANGYNCYGSFANATSQWNYLTDGRITGPFLWCDSFVGEVWMNSGLQSAMMTLLLNQGTIPYNNAGAQMINAASLDVIAAGLNFGSIRAGVTLSASQAAAVNAAAGKVIDTTLSAAGWYLLVGQASPAVRVARGSPPITLFYMDGQAVQSINISSVQLQ